MKIQLLWKQVFIELIHRLKPSKCVIKEIKITLKNKTYFTIKLILIKEQYLKNERINLRFLKQYRISKIDTKRLLTNPRWINTLNKI